MIAILASVIDGVLVGAVYGLAAMGLTLIWGVMNVINLAHGAVIVYGMFALYLLATSLGVPAYASIPVVIVCAFLFGVGLYWVAIHRVIGRPILMSLLATFAVNMVLIGLGTAIWTTSPFNVPVALPGISFSGYTFTGTHIMAAVLAVVIAGALYLLLYHTRIGKGIRAVASNRDAAELSGIPTTRMLAIAFGLGVTLAGVSGTLIATLFPFTVLSGEAYQLKSFVVTVLGGLGNPAGALLGGIALGLVEGAATPFMPVTWTPVIEFGLFVACLLAFPRGIFSFTKA
jgi:branched-subunit amino acid ABC-type transport system permease component